MAISIDGNEYRSYRWARLLVATTTCGKVFTGLATHMHLNPENGLDEQVREFTYHIRVTKGCDIQAITVTYMNAQLQSEVEHYWSKEGVSTDGI